MWNFSQMFFGTKPNRPNPKAFLQLAAGVLMLSTAAVSAQEAQGPVVLVKQAYKETIWPSFQHPARLEALHTATVRPIIAAQIVSVNFKAGDLVTKGDLLLELDQTDYLIAVAEAEANVKQAEANAVKADSDFDRAEKLVGRGTVSQRDLDYAQANKDVAAAQVKIAKARLDRAVQNLEDTKVHAPFDGRISAPNFAVGDLFAPGDPTQPGSIAELVSLDPIYATSHVDQSMYFNYLARRSQLEKGGVEIPPLVLDLILPGGNSYPVQGEFENWDSTAVASTGTIAARVLFSNENGELLPGENVSLRGAFINGIETVLVPQRAVSFDQQGHYVWTIQEGNIATRQNIQVGVRDGANWAVPQGLEDGATVVVEGLQKVREGAAVTPKPFEG